jgi:hypothetical protein
VSSGYAYKCNQCGEVELHDHDLLMRQAPPPEGWLTVEWIKDGCVRRGDFCGTKCLLGWVWDESK